MKRRKRLFGLTGAAVLSVMLIPASPALACSCAEITVTEMSDQEPDAVVARIRRVDEGGSQGIGRVLQVLSGPPLPADMPLDLDTGASCLPWVSVGEVAVLTFVPEADGWRTLECGMLDPASGLEPVAVDPAAEGPVAVVMFGRLPGAELVALDDRLRVLSVAAAPADLQQLEVCGGHLLALGYDEQGRLVAALLELPSFTQTARYVPFDDPEIGVEYQDAMCRPDGTVDLLVRTLAEQQRMQLHTDVFGDVGTFTVPDSEAAAFTPDAVAILQPAAPRRGPLTVSILEPSTGEREQILQHPAAGYELTVSPDGRHALVRGYDDEPLVLTVDLSTGRIVGESRGWWQPTQHPWLGTDRILQMDEDSGSMAGSGLQHYRLVDLSLQVVAGLRPLTARTIGAFQATVVVTTSDGLTILDADAQPVSTLVQPWIIGATGVLQVGPVATDPAAEMASAFQTPSQAAETSDRRGRSEAASPPVPGLLAALATILLVAVALRVRQRSIRR